MLNKSILMGRLTRDPKLRHTPNNTPVTSFTLAVDRGVKRTGDPAQQTADFIDIVAWNQTAEFAVKYFRKGQLVAVAGRIQTRKWKDNEDKPRTAFEIVADELHFAEARRDEQTAPTAPARDVPDLNEGFNEEVGDDDQLPF